MPPIQYFVEGGHRLKGAIEPSGNKNAALPIIAAALLTEHPVRILLTGPLLVGQGERCRRCREQCRTPPSHGPGHGLTREVRRSVNARPAALLLGHSLRPSSQNAFVCAVLPPR